MEHRSPRGDGRLHPLRYYGDALEIACRRCGAQAGHQCFGRFAGLLLPHDERVFHVERYMMSLDQISAIVAAKAHVDPEELRMRTRRRPVAQARHVAMYLAHLWGYRTAEIGAYFGRSRNVALVSIDKCRAIRKGCTP